MTLDDKDTEYIRLKVGAAMSRQEFMAAVQQFHLAIAVALQVLDEDPEFGRSPGSLRIRSRRDCVRIRASAIRSRKGSVPQAVHVLPRIPVILISPDTARRHLMLHPASTDNDIGAYVLLMELAASMIIERTWWEWVIIAGLPLLVWPVIPLLTWRHLPTWRHRFISLWVFSWGSLALWVVMPPPLPFTYVFAVAAPLVSSLLLAMPKRARGRKWYE